MRIVCPQCGYSREIPGDKIPSRSSIATCPKCQFRFRFRADLMPQQAESILEEPVYPPRPSRPAPRPEAAGSGMEAAMPAFTPRTQRAAKAYEPDGQQLPYRESHAHSSSRSSARWLPDPEPDAPEPFRDQPRAPFEPPRFPQGAPLAGAEDGAPSAWTAAGPQGGQCDVYEEAHDGPPYDDHGDEKAGHPENLREDLRGGLGEYLGDSATDDSVATLYADDPPPLAPGVAAAPIGYEREPEAFTSMAAPQAVPASSGSGPGPGHEPEPAEPDFWQSSSPRPDDFSRLSSGRQAGLERLGRDGRPWADGPEGSPRYVVPLRTATTAGRATTAPSDDGHDVQGGQGEPNRGERADFGGGGAPVPTEGTAGNDSVRDIWARLQTMGDKERVPLGRAGEPAQDQPRREPPPGGESVAPWEQLEHYGVVPAFLNTLKNILLKPGEFFVGLPTSGGMIRPLLFAMVVCEVAALSCLVWNFFGLGPNFAELGRTEWFQGLGSGHPLGGVALLGLAPVVLVLSTLLDAALSHLLLGLLRGASRPFPDTFRTVCYAGGPWILATLPMSFGYLIPIVLIWHMTLQAIGLKKLHEAGYPQVLAAVLVKWSLFFMGSFAVLHMLFTRR